MRHSCTSSGLIEVMVEGSSVTATIRSVFGSKSYTPLPVEPDRDRPAVRVETFRGRERHSGFAQRRERGRIAAEDRGAFHEVENAEARGEARRARGRQDVVAAADIVADRLRRVVTK